MMIESLLRPRSWLASPRVRWLAVVAWMALIFAFSAQPDLPSLSERWLDIVLKNAAHFFVYAVLAALLFFALNRGHRAYGWAWVLAVLYAISDEWHQSFVPGRQPDLWDVLVDACGAAVALLMIARSYR